MPQFPDAQKPWFEHASVYLGDVEFKWIGNILGKDEAMNYAVGGPDHVLADPQPTRPGMTVEKAEQMGFEGVYRKSGLIRRDIRKETSRLNTESPFHRYIIVRAHKTRGMETVAALLMS